jgi:hypothetical protein
MKQLVELFGFFRHAPLRCLTNASPAGEPRLSTDAIEAGSTSKSVNGQFLHFFFLVEVSAIVATEVLPASPCGESRLAASRLGEKGENGDRREPAKQSDITW